MPPLFTPALWSTRHGRGLLALRLSLAACLAAEGTGNVMAGVAAAANHGSGAFTWIVGVALMVCGALIGIGFLIPAVPLFVIAISLGGVADRLFVLGVPFTSTDSWQTILLEVTISAALVMIGPGCYSLDAYLFGYKEINIPSRVPSSSATQRS